MTDRGAVVVVGGDSLVGGAAFHALARRGRPVLATTRRRNTLGGQRIYLDFEDDAPFHVPEAVRYAIVVAAATNYERCVRDPLARVINVELIPRLIGHLLDQGLFVSFISSNSVFGGERPWPGEDDEHTPGIAYAQQKSEGERAVVAIANRLEASDRLNIVRLTKILNLSVPPIPTWISSWKDKKVIEPFSDLIFAPLSLNFVANSLATISEMQIPGNLHLSGAANVTYVDFAYALAERFKAEILIKATTAAAKGITIPFKPTYSGLGMRRTTSLTGIEPQPIADVINDLVLEIESDMEK